MSRFIIVNIMHPTSESIDISTHYFDTLVIHLSHLCPVIHLLHSLLAWQTFLGNSEGQAIPPLLSSLSLQITAKIFEIEKISDHN